MATVRFATKCDKCGRRSEEYTAWPVCRECGEDVCSLCDVAGERSEDEANRTLCQECRDAECGVAAEPRKAEQTIPEVSYSQFCQLVLSAAGPFGYIFVGRRMHCDPLLYVSRHGLAHVRANANLLREAERESLTRRGPRAPQDAASPNWKEN